jgi:hypothetical protein
MARKRLPVYYLPPHSARTDKPPRRSTQAHRPWPPVSPPPGRVRMPPVGNPRHAVSVPGARESARRGPSRGRGASGASRIRVVVRSETSEPGLQIDVLAQHLTRRLHARDVMVGIARGRAEVFRLPWVAVPMSPTAGANPNVDLSKKTRPLRVHDGARSPGGSASPAHRTGASRRTDRLGSRLPLPGMRLCGHSIAPAVGCRSPEADVGDARAVAAQAQVRLPGDGAAAHSSERAQTRSGRGDGRRGRPIDLLGQQEGLLPLGHILAGHPFLMIRVQPVCLLHPEGCRQEGHAPASERTVRPNTLA